MNRSLVSLFTGNLVSKLFAFGREIAFAAWFGTGDTAAAYRVSQSAFTIPIQAVIGESLSAGITPYYNSERVLDSARGDQVIATALAIGTVASAIITFVLYYFANQVVNLLAPGLPEGVQETAVLLLKIISLATPFYILGATTGYVEAAHGKYSAISWRPTLLNISALAGAAAAYYTGFDHWLSTSLILGHIVFFGLTIRSMRATGTIPPLASFRLGVLAPRAKSLIYSIAPLLAVPMILQCNVALERIVASWIGTSTIPATDYARFIMDTWVNVIALPLGVYTLSKYGGRTWTDMRLHVLETSKSLLAIAFPIGIFTFLYSREIVTVVYARGSFGTEAIVLTSSILSWLGVALGFMVSSYYLVRTLTAQLRYREAALSVLVACTLNAAFNLIFWKSVGAQTVGMGVLIYSMTLFVIVTVRLGFKHEFLPLLPPLLFLLIASYFTKNLIASMVTNTEIIILSGAVTGLGFLTIVAIFSMSFRAALGPLQALLNKINLK